MWWLIVGVTIVVILLAICYFAGRETAKLSSQFRYDMKRKEKD